MRAVILAGGKGTRLRPFTTTLPKPLVPVGEQAIMEVIVKQFVRAGGTHITVAVSHLAQLIAAYFGNGEKWGIKIDYSIEDRPLNTIGPLRLIKDLPEHFLVMNGDILTDLSFADLYQTHLASRAMATVSTYERDVKIDFGVLRYEPAERRVTDFTEKPVEHFGVSMGVYAFSRKILDLVPAEQPFGFDHLMLAMIAGGYDVRAYPYRGFWLDIGRPDDYERATADCDAILAQCLPPVASGEAGEA